MGLKIRRTGSLGDYLGLPTFGTRISSTSTFSDNLCNGTGRGVTDDSLETCMNSVRSNNAIPNQTCTDHLNTDGTQTIVFAARGSAKVIPSSVSQVGIDITLTGGESSVFDGVRGFFVLQSDDSQYITDFPIAFKKSPDGVIGARISSVDASLS